MIPTYNIHKSYDENYNNGPDFSGEMPKSIKNKPIKLWGHVINSPLGIPAGPLLNAEYINLYAKLGFDLPIYKTVRTIQRDSHPKPNCLLVDRENALLESDIGSQIYSAKEQDTDKKSISITNSFGIPSKPIEIWQSDIEKANNTMDKNQLMIVSCVGTPLPERNIIEDYVLCATLAVEAGAKAIELNLSCPNVTSKEGSIYQDKELSSIISKAVKNAIKDTPLMIKIGYISDLDLLGEIIKANAPYVDSIAAINTISMQAINQFGQQALPGKGRLNSGICGKIIKDIGLQMTKNLYTIKQKNNYDYTICGVGGITSPSDFDDYLNAGANIVMSATGAMWNPYLALEWRK
jgi:dihydroorotate dehydrogenase (NAD+) catalytic subunit